MTLGVGGRTKPYAAGDFHESAAHGEVFVFERDDEIAGVAVLLPPHSPGCAIARGEEAELSRLAVSADTRHQGIGRALTRFCEERARAAGWQAIALWSRPLQTEAHRLYKSLGCRRAPERDTVDATGHGRLVFVLALDQAGSKV